MALDTLDPAAPVGFFGRTGLGLARVVKARVVSEGNAVAESVDETSHRVGRLHGLGVGHDFKDACRS